MNKNLKQRIEHLMNHVYKIEKELDPHDFDNYGLANEFEAIQYLISEYSHPETLFDLSFNLRLVYQDYYDQLNPADLDEDLDNDEYLEGEMNSCWKAYLLSKDILVDLTVNYYQLEQYDYHEFVLSQLIEDNELKYLSDTHFRKLLKYTPELSWMMSSRNQVFPFESLEEEMNFFVYFYRGLLEKEDRHKKNTCFIYQLIFVRIDLNQSFLCNKILLNSKSPMDFSI